MKRIITIILAAALALSMMSVVSFADDVQWATTEGGINGYWLRNPEDESCSVTEAGITFKSDSEITGVGLGQYWASNPSTGNGKALSDVTVTVYKYETNYSTTITSDYKAMACFSPVGDNNVGATELIANTEVNCTLTGWNGTTQGFELVFDKALPAGQYLVTISNDGDAGSYIVLPTDTNPAATCIFYKDGTVATEGVKLGVQTAEELVAADPDYSSEDKTINAYSVDGHGYCFDAVYSDDDKLGSGGVATVTASTTAEVVKFQGWVGYNSAEIDEFYYSVDGHAAVRVDGAKVAVASSDPVAAAGNGGANASRFRINVNIADLKLTDGVHTLRPVAKLTDGTYHYIGNCIVKVGDPSTPVKAYVSTDGTPSAWVGNNNGTSVSATFNAGMSFQAITIPAYWASVGDNAPEVTMSIINEDGDVVASAVSTCDGDNSAGKTWTLNEVVEKGKYTLKISIQNDTVYFVMSKVTEELADEVIDFDSKTFGFIVVFTEATDTPFLSLAEAEEEETKVHGASFDTFKENGSMSKIHNGSDGAASAKLDAIDRIVDRSDGSTTTIGLRGWIGFNKEIEALGYQIDDNDPVFGDFVEAFGAEADKNAVQADANGGEYAIRFDIEVPVEKLKGTHTIVAVAKVDGEVYKIDADMPTVGAATCPNTSFTYVGPAAGNVSYEDYEDAIGMSFDTFYINGAMPNAIQTTDGNAQKAIKAADGILDGSDGSITSICYRGWAAFDQKIVAFGYSLGENDFVFDESFSVKRADVEAAISPNGVGYEVTVPLTDVEGVNVIYVVAKLADGTVVMFDDSTILEYHGPVEEPEPDPDPEPDPEPESNVVNTFDTSSSDPINAGTWLGNGNAASRTVKFNATVPFTSVVFPQYWAGRDSSAPAVTITLTNANGETVATVTQTVDGDCAAASEFVFDSEVPAGEYTMTVSVADATGTYIVLPGVDTTSLDDTTIKFGDKAFAFGLNFTTSAATYYAALTVSPNPSTADASIVMMIVAAAAVAVTMIVRKKEQL